MNPVAQEILPQRPLAASLAPTSHLSPRYVHIHHNELFPQHIHPFIYAPSHSNIPTLYFPQHHPSIHCILPLLMKWERGKSQDQMHQPSLASQKMHPHPKLLAIIAFKKTKSKSFVVIFVCSIILLRIDLHLLIFVLITTLLVLLLHKTWYTFPLHVITFDPSLAHWELIGIEREVSV